MNRVFIAVATELREQLYAGRFRCLESFLFELADQCAADEVGIVSVNKNEFALWTSAAYKTRSDRGD